MFSEFANNVDENWRIRGCVSSFVFYTLAQIYIFVFLQTFLDFISQLIAIDTLLICILFPYLAGYDFDFVFDWTILKYQQTQKTKSQVL